jgi:hypothetical protein
MCGRIQAGRQGEVDGLSVSQILGRGIQAEESVRRNQHANSGNGMTCKTTKGYPRVTAGPLRHQYVHRIVAAAIIGRDLKKDEQVDHRDRNRLNFHFSNLIVRGEKDHGWVSAKQAYFMDHIKEVADKKEWDEFMAEEDAKRVKEIAVAKAKGEPWQCEDGKLEDAWDVRHGDAELQPLD